jgi:phosphonate metabolism protein PhnN/1,5-bisphosphokinase (PRPP-forming)
MLARLKAGEVVRMLVLVVGPSGAGKDSLLNAARQAFRDDPRIHFARRVITRPEDPLGENHEPVTGAEFAARDFALSWSAHGLSYGIPAMDMAPVVVANVSRGVIAEAARRFPIRVIEVTAPAEILAERLTARRRETASDVAGRLARTAAIPDGVAVDTVWNDGTLSDGVERFVAVLRGVVDAAASLNDQ